MYFLWFDINRLDVMVRDDKGLLSIPMTAVSYKEGSMQAGCLSRLLLCSRQHRQLPGLVPTHRCGGDLLV